MSKQDRNILSVIMSHDSCVSQSDLPIEMHPKKECRPRIFRSQLYWLVMENDFCVQMSRVNDK